MYEVPIKNNESTSWNLQGYTIINIEGNLISNIFASSVCLISYEEISSF
jgi:hypothetical protein